MLPHAWFDIALQREADVVRGTSVVGRGITVQPLGVRR
jgi:hypothetical protein